jgi:hypothetical protein
MTKKVRCLHLRKFLTITPAESGSDKFGRWVSERIQCSGCGDDRIRRYYPDFRTPFAPAR